MGNHRGGRPGKLFVIGIGPGSKEQLTTQALTTLKSCAHIVGYKSYTNKIKKILPDKTYHAFSMGKEEDRVKFALDLSRSGEKVGLISSGDPGIYGMAGLALEMADGPELGDNPETAGLKSATNEKKANGLNVKISPIEVEIISGMSALNFCGSLLGAPLTNDFAVVSLSDILTPWKKIEERLRAVVGADLCVVLYNPTSSKRQPQFIKALKIIEKIRGGDTPVGYVKQKRDLSFITDVLKITEIDPDKIDMNTTLFIGNSDTTVKHGKMITKRGYERKK